MSARTGKLSAHVRVSFTGYVVRHSYAYGSMVASYCDHHHQNAAMARRCANLMLRRLVAKDIAAAKKDGPRRTHGRGTKA